MMRLVGGAIPTLRPEGEKRASTPQKGLVMKIVGAEFVLCSVCNRFGAFPFPY